MEEAKYPDNFNYTFLSIRQLKLAIGELDTLNRYRTDKKETWMLNHPMFSVFNHSLMYMVIMEYCKLIAKDSKRSTENQNFSSIGKLSETIFNTIPTFKDVHENNIQRLDSIREGKIGKKMKLLRDKKYAHSDKHLDSNPFLIERLKMEEIELLKKDFAELVEINQICFNQYENAEWDAATSDDEIEGFVKENAPNIRFPMV